MPNEERDESVLEEVRAARARSAERGGVEPGDLELPLGQAMTEHDMTSGEVAAAVRRLLACDDAQLAETLAPPPRAPRQSRPPEKVESLATCDQYACERHPKVRAWVTYGAGRKPERAPTCPACEQEMTFVDKFLRPARWSDAGLRWSDAGLRSGGRDTGP